jgi:hypothetical protein
MMQLCCGERRVLIVDNLISLCFPAGAEALSLVLDACIVARTIDRSLTT